MSNRILEPKTTINLVNNIGNSPPDPPDLNPPYFTDAVEFDGTNDFLLRGALTSVVDGKFGILSCWFNLSAGDSVNRTIFASNTARILLYIPTNNRPQLQIFDTSGAQVVSFATLGAVLANTGWHHFLAGWRGDTGIGAMYLDDVLQDNIIGSSVNDLEYTETNYGFGGRVTGSQKITGCVSDFYFNTVDYLDFEQVANRRKFITEELKPVDAGENGTTPTGNQPAIFFKGDNENYHQNLGYGGAFTVNGSLENCASAPSG